MTVTERRESIHAPFSSTAAGFGGRNGSQVTERTLLLDPDWLSNRKYAHSVGSAIDGDGSVTASSPTVGCCPSQVIEGDDSTAWKSRTPARSPSRHLDRVSLTLQNSGSVARDHLASERTFLAYMRTSLTITSAGIALVQLLSGSTAESGTPSNRLPFYIRMLGAGAIILGLLVLLIGVTRYFTIQAALVKGLFPVARLATATIALLLTTLVTMTFGMLLTGQLNARG